MANPRTAMTIPIKRPSAITIITATVAVWTRPIMTTATPNRPDCRGFHPQYRFGDRGGQFLAADRLSI
jgi:hypothetical protein